MGENGKARWYGWIFKGNIFHIYNCCVDDFVQAAREAMMKKRNMKLVKDVRVTDGKDDYKSQYAKYRTKIGTDFKKKI